MFFKIVIVFIIIVGGSKDYTSSNLRHYFDSLVYTVTVQKSQ